MYKIIMIIGLLWSDNNSIAQNITNGLLDSNVYQREATDTALVKAVSVANSFHRVGDAVVYSWASPLRWKQRDFITAGAIAGSTGVLLLADKPINDFLGRNKSDVMDGVERTGYHLGKPYAAFITMSGFYVAGQLFKSEWARETALILGSSYISSGVLQTFMKTAIGRARPGAGVGNLNFRPFEKGAPYHSFPSGHIQIAMTTAVVLAERVNSPVLKTLFYTSAATTLVGRMYSHSHWVSDLFFGGVLSWYIAKTNIKRWEMTRKEQPFRNMLVANKKKRIDWQIGTTNDGVGIVGRIL